jgi:hypothetical protein
VVHVLVAGAFKKRDGKIVGHDIAALRQRIAASNVHLLDAVAHQGAVATATTSAYSNAIAHIVDE